MEQIISEIKIAFIQGKKFSFSYPRPEKNFKHDIIIRTFLHCSDKSFIFFLRPEIQFFRIRFSHLLYFFAWIVRQIIDFNCVCIESSKLILNHPLIGWFITFCTNFILPCNNICRSNFIHLFLTKIGKNMSVHHITLISDRILFQFAGFILKINFNKTGKGHIHITGDTGNKFHFKLHRFLFCSEASFHFLFALSHPVCITERSIPCPLFPIFVN